MEDEKLWNYVGKGAYIDGIPARDLTAADWARLNEDDRAAVERAPLYRRAPRPKVEEPEPEEAAVEPQSEPGEENKTPKGAKVAREAKE